MGGRLANRAGTNDVRVMAISVSLPKIRILLTMSVRDEPSNRLKRGFQKSTDVIRSFFDKKFSFQADSKTTDTAPLLTQEQTKQREPNESASSMVVEPGSTTEQEQAQRPKLGRLQQGQPTSGNNPDGFRLMSREEATQIQECRREFEASGKKWGFSGFGKDK